jgi:hypothetical protein
MAGWLEIADGCIESRCCPWLMPGRWAILDTRRRLRLPVRSVQLVETGTRLRHRPSEGACQVGRGALKRRVEELPRGEAVVVAGADVEPATGELHERRRPSGSVLLHASRGDQQLPLQLKWRAGSGCDRRSAFGARRWTMALRREGGRSSWAVGGSGIDSWSSTVPGPGYSAAIANRLAFVILSADGGEKRGPAVWGPKTVSSRIPKDCRLELEDGDSRWLS